MRFRFVRFCVPLFAAVCGLPFAAPVFAHPLDVAYLDFAASSTSMSLTVAIHPYQAYELVRGKKDDPRFDLKVLKKHGDIVSAYVQDNVTVLRNGKACDWSPADAYTPDTELDAVADGVTVAGQLICPGTGMVLSARSTLFLAGYPSQTAVLRLDLPDGYAERKILDRTTREGEINLTELFQTSISPDASSGTISTAIGRRPDAQMADIARRLLDPGLGVVGLMGVLLSAMLIGALHALGPGHGKSLLAATLVGEQATISRVVALGTVMTLTHVSDVFLMTFVAGLIASVVPPTQLLVDLEIVSAFGLVVLGFWNLVRAVLRYRIATVRPEVSHEEEGHRRAHELGLPHAHGPAEVRHHHDLSSQPSFGHALWLGFVGSLAPCPTAWAIFAATLSIGRLGTGVLLLVAFTMGLQLTILAIGFLIVVSKKFALRRTSPRFTYALPVISACIIMCLGTVLLLRNF